MVDLGLGLVLLVVVGDLSLEVDSWSVGLVGVEDLPPEANSWSFFVTLNSYPIVWPDLLFLIVKSRPVLGSALSQGPLGISLDP